MSLDESGSSISQSKCSSHDRSQNAPHPPCLNAPRRSCTVQHGAGETTKVRVRVMVVCGCSFLAELERI